MYHPTVSLSNTSISSQLVVASGTFLPADYRDTMMFLDASIHYCCSPYLAVNILTGKVSCCIPCGDECKNHLFECTPLEDAYNVYISCSYKNVGKKQYAVMKIGELRKEKDEDCLITAMRNFIPNYIAMDLINCNISCCLADKDEQLLLEDDTNNSSTNLYMSYPSLGVDLRELKMNSLYILKLSGNMNKYSDVEIEASMKVSHFNSEESEYDKEEIPKTILTSKDGKT
ncbi:hypothetical protein CHUAL_011124 [Chamberlinius hualienensis]